MGLTDFVAAGFASPLSASELLGLFGHFLVLSLLAVGGAWLTAPRHLPLVRRLAQ